jgi:hypothetical protein
MDITPWFEWFPACLGRDLGGVKDALLSVLRKARIGIRSIGLDPSTTGSEGFVNRLLDGFDGKLFASKYANFRKKADGHTAARYSGPA